MSVLGRQRPAGRESAWARLQRQLLSLLYLRQPPSQVCLECSVDYVPELTEGRCPICGAGTGLQEMRRTRRRDLAGLGLVWLVGVIIFLLLVHALYG